MIIGGGAFLALIGIIVLIPLLSRPVIALVRPLLHRVFGVSGKLAGAERGPQPAPYRSHRLGAGDRPHPGHRPLGARRHAGPGHRQDDHGQHQGRLHGHDGRAAARLDKSALDRAGEGEGRQRGLPAAGHLAGDQGRRATPSPRSPRATWRRSST